MWPRESRRGLYLTIAGAVLVVLSLPIGAVCALMTLVEPSSASDSYVEAVAGDPPLLNPVLAPFTLAGQDVVPLVFAGLVRADAAGNVSPDLAEAVETEGDGRAYLV